MTANKLFILFLLSKKSSRKVSKQNLPLLTKQIIKGISQQHYGMTPVYQKKNNTIPPKKLRSNKVQYTYEI